MEFPSRRVFDPALRFTVSDTDPTVSQPPVAGVFTVTAVPPSALTDTERAAPVA